VTRVDVTRIHNTYNRTIVENNVRTSFNGGAGGVRHEPTADERLAERDAHRTATPMQLQHERFASTNRQQFASTNNGAPALTATPRAYNRSGTMDTRVTREANVQRGSDGPQGQHDRSRADRGGQPMSQPQARTMQQPHAGGPPQEHAVRTQGGPQGRPEGGHQGGRQEGGERHEGR
jgi:hypothetical protein